MSTKRGSPWIHCLVVCCQLVLFLQACRARYLPSLDSSVISDVKSVPTVTNPSSLSQHYTAPAATATVSPSTTTATLPAAAAEVSTSAIVSSTRNPSILAALRLIDSKHTTALSSRRQPAKSLFTPSAHTTFSTRLPSGEEVSSTHSYTKISHAPNPTSKISSSDLVKVVLDRSKAQLERETLVQLFLDLISSGIVEFTEDGGIALFDFTTTSTLTYSSTVKTTKVGLAHKGTAAPLLDVDQRHGALSNDEEGNKHDDAIIKTQREGHSRIDNRQLRNDNNNDNSDSDNNNTKNNNAQQKQQPIRAYTDADAEPKPRSVTLSQSQNSLLRQLFRRAIDGMDESSFSKHITQFRRTLKDGGNAEGYVEMGHVKVQVRVRRVHESLKDSDIFSLF